MNQDIYKLLASINNYAKTYLIHELKGQEVYVDYNRFEADVKLFTDWFKNEQYKMQPKLEYFYAPYITDAKVKE